MNEENQKRDQKFSEAISQINEDIRTLNWKTEGHITTLEKEDGHQDQRKVCKEIDEKISALETKMETMEKTRSEATAMDCDGRSTNERSQKFPIDHKAVATGLKEDSDEKEVKAVIEETIKAVGMKEEKYTIDCPATPLLPWNSKVKKSEIDT